MKAIVSVIGKDKKGIIARVSGELFDMDINIGVTTAIAVILVALVITLIVLFFVVTPYVVSGESMMPTLQDGDHIMVRKVGFTIERGDIILFDRPNAEYPPVKRVIAVAGDTVMFNGETWVVNGEALEEDYVLQTVYESDYVSPFTCDSTEIYETITNGFTLGEGELFVLGDNRNNSEDSRFADVGFVPLDLVKGKASMAFWPVDRWRMLP